MSTSSPAYIPTAPIRAGFEAAARIHEAARRSGPALPIAAPRPGTSVEAAIARAAEQTSVDFGYLLAQAEVESSLDPHARARTSSATGLYQFIDSTWLSTVKKHGSRFGLGDVADSIGVTASGSAYVADPAQRDAILGLRKDPQVAALMAAGLAEDNRTHLTPILGRQPDHAELYLAHFLGAGGAGRFLSELRADPGQSAPALFAKPAAANRAIFYSADGAPRSLAGVMEVLGAKLERALDHAGSGPGVRLARTDRAHAAPFSATPFPAAGGAMSSFGTSPQLAASPPRMAMSQVLGAAFGDEPGAAPVQVRRAYDQLKAFGL
ncbi:transglycosylase SLT domain-containing protein [Erythrobacter sp. NFXS35]|uniref:transglycosylase SLT domain-containing protein n=1 Tax=Erythrobacter sp. NFXS35 TaxID=2818436 RepID=UPI0032DE33B2